MNINQMTAPLGVKRNETFTIPWGKNPTPPEDPFLESLARDVIATDEMIASSHAKLDNAEASGWSNDLDPSAGRVLRTTGAIGAAELQGGTVNPALSVRFDPTTKALSSLDITTENHNMTKHVTWKNGVFDSAVEQRVLADGRVEDFSLIVDSVNGTLTYTTTGAAS